ncbi:MAG: flippase [Candidatus Aenigmarchaeota archaeon]|nr:flippase [Candidatus Aenigmarchaeota archaeon]
MDLKSVSKGSFYLMASTFIFMVTGYLIHFALARLLGPVSYGIYGVVVSLITIFNLVLTSGIYQAVSKHISAGEDPEAVKKAAINLQLAFSAVLFVAYEVLSGTFAVLLGDSSLAYYIRLSGFIMIGYSLYSVITGYFNGLGKYKAQAGIQTLYSFVKTFFMVGFVVLGFSVGGAFIGFAFAPILAFLVGLYISQGKSKVDLDWKILADFAWPVILYTVALNFLISVDLFSVNSILGSVAETGYYNAATTIARLPYSILCAIGVALFPAISMFYSNGEKKRAKTYLKEAARYLIILITPATALIIVTSPVLISLLYTGTYLEASEPLRILSVGFAFLTIFSVLASCLMAIGKTKLPMAISLSLGLLSIILNRLLIPFYGLNGAAYATTIACILGTIAICAFSIKNLGNFISWSSILRVLLASGIMVAASPFLAVTSKWLLPAEYLILGAIYLLVLLATREITEKDFSRIYNAMPGKARSLLMGIKLYRK